MTRCSLYVPGDRPERFDKAVASGADAVILDLEDGVAERNKAVARANVAAWLATDPGDATLVRINSDHTHRALDLAAVADAGGARVVVPKADPERCAIPGMAVVALIETAHGVGCLDEIANTTSVYRLALGEADLAEALGMWPSPDGREFAGIRSQVVVASARAGLEAPVGPVPVDLDDLDALAVTSQSLRRQGFGGRSVIHPKQVATVTSAFSPTADELEWARGVLEASERADGGISVHHGGFVDAPIVARARRIIHFGAPT